MKSGSRLAPLLFILTGSVAIGLWGLTFAPTADENCLPIVLSGPLVGAAAYWILKQLKWALGRVRFSLRAVLVGFAMLSLWFSWESHVTLVRRGLLHDLVIQRETYVVNPTPYRGNRNQPTTLTHILALPRLPLRQLFGDKSIEHIQPDGVSWGVLDVQQYIDWFPEVKVWVGGRRK